jgi:regulator of replication initiation timing
MNTEDTKKKTTVRISKKDLLKLLADNEHYQKQITELQTRNTELLLENRELKQKTLPDKPKFELPENDPTNDPTHPDFFPNFSPDAYIDGASRFRP